MAKKPVVKRKKKFPSDDLTAIQSRVSPVTAEQLLAVAARENRSVSAQVAIILEQWLSTNAT